LARIWPLVWGWLLFLVGTAAGQVVVDLGDHTLVVGTTEVTQGLYERITGHNPSAHRGAELPVDSVSWSDAVIFCNALSLADGLEPVYGPSGPDRSRGGWRLPTEAEWKSFARAQGPETLTETAWFANNAERRTHAVGLLSPNHLGLYDLFGNVWEWCDADRSDGLQVDHGGGYRSNATFLTPDAGGLQGPGSWGDDLGFRVVRSGSQVPKGTTPGP